MKIWQLRTAKASPTSIGHLKPLKRLGLPGGSYTPLKRGVNEKTLLEGFAAYKTLISGFCLRSSDFYL